MRRVAVLLLCCAAFATGAQAQNQAACCSVTAIDARTGNVSGKVNASGQTFVFRLTDAKLLPSLRVGQAVYANLGAKEVSLDGKSIVGPIVSIAAAPLARVPLNNVPVLIPPKGSGGPSGSSGSGSGGSATAGGNSGTAGSTASAQNCPSGYSICGSACAELSGDANNCGACGARCAGGAICSSGRCVAAITGCPAGQTKCGQGCFNIASDVHQCGACGFVCGPNQICSNGQCKATSAAGDASAPDSVSVALGLAQDVALDAAPIRGSRDAAVLIIEFADYQCPFCQQMEPRLKKLQAELGNNMALAFKDFPLSIHPYAEKAAEAARCAGEQGRFWDFNNVLFNSSNLEVDQLKQYARLLALDSKSFDHCLDSGKEAAAVQRDVAQGHLLGIDGTPSFFINGRPFSGAVDYDTLRQIAERELPPAMPPALISKAASR
jgi:protein-disulfide isomerase